MLLNTVCLRTHISARTAPSGLSKVINPAPLTTVVARCSHHAASAAHNDRPAPTIAIIGSGPAGFYTAQKVMRDIKGTKVDMYEQLPVPFGLVRFGVAPDHPEVKVSQAQGSSTIFELTPSRTVKTPFKTSPRPPSTPLLGT